MNKQLLFIQGGGNNGYEADTALVNSLQNALGTWYEIHYQKIRSDETAPDFGWVQEIGRQISAMKDNFILVGHSFGSSMILKLLSEQMVEKKIAGIFLLSTPFWSGEEDWIKGLKLQEHFAERLPEDIPMFFYHCMDDEEVPFSHMAFYMEKLARATFRELPQGGHQFNNNLTVVAQDILSLNPKSRV